MRYINNFIKLRELTAEDRYRQAKGLPPKEDESPYDILEKYKDDPMIMISFRSEYYTNTKRLGVNLRSIYNTPNGIYCYPLSIIWKNFDHKNRKITGIPFTGRERPRSIVIMRLKDRGLNLSNYDEQDYYNDIGILQSNFPRTLDFSEYERKAKSYFSSFSSDDYSTVRFDKNYIDSYYIWGVTKGIFNDVKPNSKSTNYWNFIFSKILGYKWVLDEGLGIIHRSEPIQCVIFENSAYDLIDSIDISKIDYRVSKDDLSVENKLIQKITYLVANSSEKNNKKIKLLLDKYPSLIKKSINGNTTLLHFVCRNNNIEIVKLLLSYPEIDVNIKDEYGYTPFHIVSINNIYIDIVKELLAHPNIDVNNKNKNGETALHLACSHDKIEIVKLLLAHPNIDVNSQNNNEWIPLHIACRYNYIEIVKLLLSRPEIDVNIQDNLKSTPLFIACFNNNIEIVKLLLSRPEIDVNTQGEYKRTPLHIACFNNINIVKLLLARPEIDVNSKDEYGTTVLFQAKRHSEKEIIDLLIQHGATE